jgi:predicted permease
MDIRAEVAEQADATVSKTVEGQPSCRFESDLRHHRSNSRLAGAPPGRGNAPLNIFLVVLESVLVLLAIGVIGFWITRRNVVPENVLGFLATLAIDIALPSIVFANILTDFSPVDFPDWWQLPLWWLVFTAMALVLVLVTRYISARETRAEFSISLFYQNGIFFPLIILSGLFGTETPLIAQLFIFIMLHPTMLFSTYYLFFKQAPGQLRWKRIVNPVLVATVVAIVLQLAGVKTYLPEFIITIFEILGAMALPLVMIILGGSLYLDFQQKGRLYISEVTKFVIVKNIVFPAATIGVLLLLRPDYNIALLFLLQSAVPPITGAPILTERSGGNRSIATQFVFASFAASVLTIPAAFYVFTMFFTAS